MNYMRKKGPNKKQMLTASPDILTQLGSFMRESRLASGISRERFCTIMDVSNSQVSTWENGKAEPRFSYLVRFCALCHVDFNRILEIYSAGMISTECTLMARYAVLSNDSQRHVNAVIDGLLLSDIMNRQNVCWQECSTDRSTNDVNESVDKAKSCEKAVSRKRGRPRKIARDEPVEI